MKEIFKNGIILELIMQSSEAYATYAGVALTSYLENNKDIKEIIVYFISDNLSAKSREIFIATTEHYKREIYFFDAHEIISKLEENGLQKFHGSYTTYCKIFLLDEIDFKTDRALYVDADTICVKGIKDILDIELTGKVCGMAAVSEKYIRKYNKIPESRCWYNAGVVLFNVEKWKNDHCTEMIYDYIAECTPNIAFAEQDILNILFHEKIREISMKYNYVYSYDMFPLKYRAKIFGWDPHIILQMLTAASTVSIYHCFPVFQKRPWHEGAYIPKMQNEWDNYWKKSLWKNVKKERKDSMMGKIQFWMFRNLPVSIYSILHGGGSAFFGKKEC